MSDELVSPLTSTLPDRAVAPILQELLEASVSAERLISALFEIGVIEDEPFMSIWSNLEKAIDKARAIVGGNECVKDVVTPA